MYEIQLRCRAEKTNNIPQRVLGRAVRYADYEARRDCILLVHHGDGLLNADDLRGYIALLVETGAEARLPNAAALAYSSGYTELSAIEDNAVIALEPTGNVNVLYRPTSKNNTIFATERCNSNCLMCSQPPTLRDDNSIVQEHLRLIDLIQEPPEVIGITGGEPTLLGNGLVEILSSLKEKFPDTHVHMLTNGRMYAYSNYVREIANIAHPNFISAIPLYADNAYVHDYVVQALGAFDQTIKGLYNAANFGLNVEIRVVLHKQTIPRLLALMEYIYRNLPFVGHVALMGLENMGYVKKNWELLWIDPDDYRSIIEKAVKHLFYRGIHVSIYNLPLCVLPKSTWMFARQSISDYKNIYTAECEECSVKKYCSGLFSSSQNRHSLSIRPIQLLENEIRTLLGLEEH